MTKVIGQWANKVDWSAIQVELGDGEPCSSKGTRDMDRLETTEVARNGHA